MASNATTMGTYLKMPMAGYRNYGNAGVDLVGFFGFYWSSISSSANNAYVLFFSSSSFNLDDSGRSLGLSVRAFKDTPVIPTSSWTTLYDGSSVAVGAGVFYNSTD